MGAMYNMGEPFITGHLPGTNFAGEDLYHP